MARVGVRTAPQARAQVRRARDWWNRNRGSAPSLLKDDLTRALALLTEYPDIGRPYAHPEIPGLRRLLLRRSQYHVYYVHETAEREVVVLAFWSAVRGRGPVLDRPKT